MSSGYHEVTSLCKCTKCKEKWFKDKVDKIKLTLKTFSESFFGKYKVNSINLKVQLITLKKLTGTCLLQLPY